MSIMVLAAIEVFESSVLCDQRLRGSWEPIKCFPVQESSPSAQDGVAAFAMPCLRPPRQDEEDSCKSDPQVYQNPLTNSSHTVDSKNLEHGCRMIYAGCPSLVWDQRTVRLQRSGFSATR